MSIYSLYTRGVVTESHCTSGVNGPFSIGLSGDLVLFRGVLLIEKHPKNVVLGTFYDQGTRTALMGYKHRFYAVLQHKTPLW
jgi:hypothetical protein